MPFLLEWCMELNANNYKVEISARHVHLSRADFVTLFGADAEMQNIMKECITDTCFPE